MEDDEWAEFDGPKSNESEAEDGPLPEADDAYMAEIADEYANLEVVLKTTKERMEVLAAELARLFPEVEGTMSRTAGIYTITMKRAERWSWDKEMLEAMFGEGELPPYVRRSLTVDKRQYQALKTSEQDALKPALTRKLAAPKIEVTPNV